MADAPQDILPFDITETTLANGLRLIVVPTGFPNLVSVQIPVQAGSRNEVEEGKSGFAHFFEHMMFRGTDRYPAARYHEILTKAGARQNAYTTDDYTNYHVTLAAEDLETLLELEADRFMNLRYSEEDFRTEARAILGEYNKSAADPLTKLIEVQRDTAYTTHTYKHTTMGFLRDIEAMPEQFAYSRQFFDRWYRPEYTTILVAGDVQPGPGRELVERYWGSWERGTFTAKIPAEPMPPAAVAAHVQWESPTLPWFTLAFHGLAFSTTDPAYAALDVLFDLSFGETSELYKRLVEREQRVDQLFPYLPPRRDPGLATILARLKDPADAEYVRDAILDTIAEARSGSLTQKRLEEAKSHARYSFARTLDNSETIAETLAHFVHFERTAGTLNALYRRYDAVTVDDVTAAAATYLATERLVQTTLANGPLATVLTAPPRVPEATRAVPQFPESGIVRRREKSPLVEMKLLFPAGSAHDPAGKAGLAALAASMIADAGSEGRRIDEINAALFPIAASFDAHVDREMTTFTGIAHRDTFERFLDISLEQLTKPGFRSEDFSRLRDMQLNALVQDLRSSNDEELGKERLQANIYAGTPYGHPVLGTEAGIASITLDDVRAFVAEHYSLAGLHAGVSGDIPPALLDRVRHELGGLAAGKQTVPVEVSGRMPQGLEVEIVAKETRATAISLGHPIEVTRPHPDFAALWLARSWLGEHRASNGRLFDRIREVRGLNYGNYAYVEAFPRGMHQFFPDPNLGRRAQVFEIWIRPVMPQNAVFALKIAIHELATLIDQGLTAEQFETTREYLEKNVFLMTKTQDQELGYALDSRWYGMGEFVSTMREGLRALTVAHVNAAVRRHLSAENLAVVFITKDAGGLRDELLRDEPTTITYEAPRPPDVLEEDRIIGARRLGLPPNRVLITPVEEVFAR
jgi:zinc protease